ncbi:hypothetical protein AB205_0184760, partial [Aquarana catesbeiana]
MSPTAEQCSVLCCLSSIKQLDRYGQLILINSSAADTGEFTCWAQLCDSLGCKKDESKTGSTYIFFTAYWQVVSSGNDEDGGDNDDDEVTDATWVPDRAEEEIEDKGELFVPSSSYFEIVYLHPDKPAIIPCRVTTASAKVTLHREFPAEEIKADGTEITYDVKKGFVYQHPTVNQSGVVYCRAEARGAPQISIKYQLLYVEVPSGPPSATITSSANKVHSGGDFSIYCTVLGEPNVEVEFTWIYPGQE